MAETKNTEMERELPLPVNPPPINHLRAKVLELIQAQLLYYNLTPAELPTHGEASNELEDLVFPIYDTYTKHIATPTQEHTHEETEEDAGPSKAKIQKQITTQVITTHKAKTYTIRWSHDGKQVAAGDEEGSVKVAETGQVGMENNLGTMKIFQDHLKAVTDISFHPTSLLLASASHDTCIKLYDLQKTSGRRAFRFYQDTRPILTVDFHPSGTFLAAGTSHNMIRLYDVKTFKCFTSDDQAHEGSVTTVRWSPDGKIYASSSSDGSIKIWDTVTGKCVKTLSKAHGGKRVNGVSFSSNGRYILSTGTDGTPRTWDVATWAMYKTYTGSDIQGRTTFNYNDSRVVGASTAGLCMWDLDRGDGCVEEWTANFPCATVDAHPEKNIYATCGHDTDERKTRWWESPAS